ncbi:MAG: hypothetical protein Kow0068_20480 [Marinilabiliales bacterium]
MANSDNKLLRILVKNRRLIQLVIGITLFIVFSYYQLSLWWFLLAGTVLGIIWGKVFCRWLCPVGIMVEGLMKLMPDDSASTMYQYHKLGCPIAWVSGLLNKISIYKVTFNPETCKNCGLCDKACYMPAINNQKFSLYKQGKSNPAENFSCSKCLKCVEQCPNGTLSFKPKLSINQYKTEKL